MSFSIPQTVPNFAAVNRAKETTIWTAAKNSLSKGDDTLPLYKDKPYGVGYSSSQPSLATKKKRRLIAYLFLMGTVFWFIYTFASKTNGDASIADVLKNSPESRRGYQGIRAENDNKNNVADSVEKIGDDSFKRKNSMISSTLSNLDKQKIIRQTFQESWDDYYKNAFGYDVYGPKTKRKDNMAPQGMGWIIVDSIDTMMIMDLPKELSQAREWVAHNLTYNQNYEVNTFETTIRMLGGLLSAYYLSKDDLYLDKATDLGNRLLGAFDSPSGIPYSSLNLATRKGVSSHMPGGPASTAEVATLQLEFKYLSKLTGESLYWQAVERVMEVIDRNNAKDGLVPIYISPDTGKFQSTIIRLGSRGDSYYEYLLKQYLQTNKEETIYKEMYDKSVDGIMKNLVAKSYPSKLTFIGELDQGIDGPLSNKMDHLVCFIGGTLALGATNGLPLSDFSTPDSKSTKLPKLSERQLKEMELAKEITKTCYEMYALTDSGIAPEIVYFNTEPGADITDMIIKPQDAHYLQRPETVESIFYMWRITKDPIYRKWGWELFESIVKYTKVAEGGYTSLDNIKAMPPSQRDNMESFWLAETLKYLYLLFEDDDTVLPLDKVVFNTEAHPLPNFDMAPLFKTGWSHKEFIVQEKDY